jgi:hypothetical protein
MTMVLYTLENVRARLASRVKRTYAKHFILLVLFDFDNGVEIFEFVFLGFNISWKHGTVTAWIVIVFSLRQGSTDASSADVRGLA